MVTEKDLEINRNVYELSVRIISALKERLGVNIKLHHSNGHLHSGEIFLFNHFARFETFIPQYLIYKETGALCRSLAAGEFFHELDTFGRYLLDLGGVPNDYPKLLPFLATEILKGRKVIIFPEGGMVKDRRVLDQSGHYSVYSRSAKERRKHHTGAAVLALTLDAFKAGILHLEYNGEMERISRWAESLGMGTADALLEAVRKPTEIVPSNITFYPIRVTDNILRRGAELFSGGLSKRFREELVIEGNILLKHTDMDLRLGKPVIPVGNWRWWDKMLIARLIRRLEKIDDFFDIDDEEGPRDERMLAKHIRRRTMRVRDLYMHRMYEGVTANLSHLASRIIVTLVEQGRTEIGRTLFHKILYLAIHKFIDNPGVFLHRSLRNPEAYIGLLEERCEGFDQFIFSQAVSHLVTQEVDKYRFLPKLLEEQTFDEIRLENLIAVYANEIAPINEACRAVGSAIKEAPGLTDRDWAEMLLKDEKRAYAHRKAFCRKPKWAVINDQETASESGEPYMFVPRNHNGLGVVLTHGFLASPAEMMPLAEKLAEAGHPVICVRLGGHGTSPWDLKDRPWQDWMMPVRRGYRIMSAYTKRIAMVGFSSGGALSLHMASEHPEGLAGVVAISTPLIFRNKNLVFVPLVHGANRLLRWAPSLDGIMPFRQNESEHPHINYRNMPISGLYELKLMVDDLPQRLPHVHAPSLIIQGTEDHVVDARSGLMIFEQLGTNEKSLHMVPTAVHGILYENIGHTQEAVISFLDSLIAKGKS